MGQFGRSGAAREVGLGAVVTGTRAGPAARNGIGYLAAMNCRLTRRARKWPCLAHKRPPRHPYPLICGCALWAACRVRGRVWVSSRAAIHRCESLTFSLWRLTGAVNGWPVEHATRPHRSGGAWSGTVAVTPRCGRLRADSLQAGYRADEPQCRYGYVGGHASEARTTSRNQLNAV